MPPEPAAGLFDVAAAVPAVLVRDQNSVAWHRPGLLSYWVDDTGRTDLEAVLGGPTDGPLLGGTAATAHSEGEDAVRGTLWGDVAVRTLGRNGFSVLRHKLFALITPRAAPVQRELTAWLEEHLLVVGIPLDAPVARALDMQLRPPVAALLRPSEIPTWAQARAEELRQAHAAARRAWYAEFQRKYAGAREGGRTTGGTPVTHGGGECGVPPDPAPMRERPVYLDRRGGSTSPTGARRHPAPTDRRQRGRGMTTLAALP